MSDTGEVRPAPGIRTILIANRGEIAVRVMRACRELSIRSVAVFSEADREALHVRAADEAVCIGPPPALESYLNVPALLEAARSSAADAVHPGYGFLAENAAFARAVVDAGITWIGPPAEVIAALGDKVAAKRLAADADVPVVPGYYGDDQSDERLDAEAERIGYPIMLKAAAGGGGKGMRAVRRTEELAAGIAAARREAHGAFGDDRLFLERLLLQPRHVEIQVLADAHGNVVHLGERDCSLQRRHQKVVEESPSPVLTDELRTAMGESAVRFARAGHYVNAGTVEFLFAADAYYFLEMNTRIQVEHPVTEAVTGLDLVQLQIAIAGGRPLPFGQIDVELRGHAIEARLYAEDPTVGFLPTTGALQIFSPPGGPGVRNDTGVEAGSELTTFYDPMLAKLVVHAGSRSGAVERLRAALDAYAIQGLRTNLPFLRWLAGQEAFARGRFDTEFIEREWQPEEGAAVPADVLAAAALFEMRQAEAPADPWKRRDGWRTSGIPRLHRFASRGVDRELRLLPQGQNTWEVQVDGELLCLEDVRVDAASVGFRRGDEKRIFRVQRRGQGLSVVAGLDVYELAPASGPVLAAGGARHHGALASLTSPMPGKVVQVTAKAGEEVTAHQALVVIEAMKMEHVIGAPYAGTVRAVLVEVGAQVEAGTPVADLEPA